MRRLFACTALTPLAAIVIVPTAKAQETVIATPTTTAVRTSVAGNIRVTDKGTVSPTAGAAITIDSAHNVRNEGKINVRGANDSTGVLALNGASGNITNSGEIVIDETYEPADADKDGDLDGPFAQGSRRYGIRVAPGGVLVGNIDNSGRIVVEGNQSAGIALDGAVQGSLTSTGNVSVVGDQSYGIRAGDVSGNVRITGSVAAQGSQSVGVALLGDVGGAVIFQGRVSSTGYRSATPPADTSKLDGDDLLQGGPAIQIAGDVAGGIYFAAPPPNTNPDDKDEDDDGIDDSAEGIAHIVSDGAAPAVEIGSEDRAVTIGPVAGVSGGYGLVIDGNIGGFGRYKDIDANALVIGGLGGDVTISGGVRVGGTVEALSNGASATAIRIGDGARADEISVGGTVRASGGSAANAFAHAILVEAGGEVRTVRNTGLISAQAGGTGTAGAIVDRSGSVNLIENQGSVRATGAGEAHRNVAIDLRANGAGAVVRQSSLSATAAAPEIIGDILFGAGGDHLDLRAGRVAGTVLFGAGDNRLSLSGGAGFTGAATFGAGSDRLLIGRDAAVEGTVDLGGGSDWIEIVDGGRLTAALSGAGGASVTVQSGTFHVTNSGAVALSSLSLGAEGILGVTIDAAGKANTVYQVAGAADLTAGARVSVRLTSLAGSPGTYTFLRAGSLGGTTSLGVANSDLPFLFSGSTTVDQAAGEARITIRRKTADELALNASEAAIYDAAFPVLDQDEGMSASFLSLSDSRGVRAALRQMLPDHAGGTFDTVTQGSRATARFLADPRPLLAERGRWGYWLQQVAWGSSRSIGDTAGYDITGWGASGGAELIMGGAGNVGVSLAYLAGEDADGATDNQVRAHQYELGAYWRGRWGGLATWARLSAAMIGFDGSRRFTGTADGEVITRTTSADWTGTLYSAAGGLSYEMRLGRFVIRPSASLDYYRLSEDGYAETGGGEAFDLVVEDREGDELAGSLTVTGGFDFAGGENGWARVELEGGWRQHLAGSLGATLARFGEGDPFELRPEERSHGWQGRLRVAGGSRDFSLGGEVGAEEQLGRVGLAARVTLQVGL